jgi:hypothetical protein
VNSIQKLKLLQSNDTITFVDRTSGLEVTAIVEGFRSLFFADGLEPHVIVRGSMGNERSIPMHAIRKRERPGEPALTF